MNEAPIHYRLLRDAVDLALLAQPNYCTAIAAARLPGAGKFDRELLRPGRRRRPVPGSLTYTVEVLEDGDLVPLCRADWRAVGLAWDDVWFELRNTYCQHDEGTHPGGPNDRRRGYNLVVGQFGGGGGTVERLRRGSRIGCRKTSIRCRKPPSRSKPMVGRVKVKSIPRTCSSSRRRRDLVRAI
jgi:hypothetical protein